MSKEVTSHADRPGAVAVDAALMGRTYAIPFDNVWQALVTLVSGRLRGWTIVFEDAHVGVIEAEVRNLVRPVPGKAVISMALDANAQTRVDIVVEASDETGDRKTNAHRLWRLVNALDRMLRVRPEQILDAGSFHPPEAAAVS